MANALVLLALSLSPFQFRGPVTIHCQLDTELAAEELRVSLAEQPELDEAIGSDGRVTLSGLPEGDLHLSFSQDGEPIGEIEVSAAQSGDLIRLKIRLVPGNAILLDEYRIKGLSESTSPIPDRPPHPMEDADAAGESVLESAPSHCPAAGEALSRTGRVVQIVDHDAFRLQADDRNVYVVYVGHATRIREGPTRLDYRDLREGMQVMVQGAVAAGPADDCSVGARQIVVQRR